MNRKKLTCIILAVVNLLCASVLLVSANPDVPADSQPAVTTPAEPSEPVGATDPYDETTPSGTDVLPSVPASSTAPSGTDSSVPAESSVPVSTAPVTRPTEIASDPGYTSDYVAQPPAYEPGDHDVQKQEWDELKEDEIVKDAQQLSVSGSSGGDSFGFIKKNTSKGDEKNPLLFILSLVCWFIALALVTFAILYRPRKKALAASAKGEAKPAQRKSSRSGKYAAKSRKTSAKLSEDDYNDGF